LDLLKGACRTGSGSRQSVCPTTKGTISVGTGYTKTGSCIRGTGLGRRGIPVGRIEAQDISLVIIPEPGPGLKRRPWEIHPDLLNSDLF